MTRDEMERLAVLVFEKIVTYMDTHYVKNETCEGRRKLHGYMYGSLYTLIGVLFAWLAKRANIW